MCAVDVIYLHDILVTEQDSMEVVSFERCLKIRNMNLFHGVSFQHLFLKATLYVSRIISHGFHGMKYGPWNSLIYEYDIVGLRCNKNHM